MKLCEKQLDSELMDRLISLSAAWEDENITYGYRKNEPGDLEGNRIFLAEQNCKIAGYLFGHMEIAKQTNSIMAEGTPYFEIEELYVLPNLRGCGIGGELFRFAEGIIREEGIDFLMLSTATKNYKSILHFYIDELGMDFWSARLFKKL